MDNTNLLSSIDRHREVTLLDILDGILEKGVVIGGDLIISVANIHLVYVELRILVTAVETILDHIPQGEDDACDRE